MTGLSYTKLMADTTARNNLETQVKASVLESLPLGYNAASIKVTFSSGSVKAKVDIEPLSSSSAAELKSVVSTKKDAISTSALNKVKAMPDVEKILQEGIDVTNVEVTSTDPIVA